MSRYILFVLFMVGVYHSQAQFEFHQPSWYQGKPYQKLIVKVGDQSRPYTQKIMQIIKENWDVCPVEFYSDTLDLSLLVDGNIFLNFERYSIASQYQRNYGSQSGISRGEVTYNDYYYLNFWVIDEKYKPKKDWWDYKYTVAKSEFYLKLIGMSEEEYKLFQIDFETLIGIRESVFRLERNERYPKEFDFTNPEFQQQYLNGMEGNLKNMIQHVNRQLRNKAEQDFFTDTKDDRELAQLKKDTLFIPNYWFGEKGTILENLKDGDQYVKAHEDYLKNLEKSYPYKVVVISRSALDQKIQSATEDFYYLNYIQSSADKIVGVVNGKTGNVIYSAITRNSFRFKEKDLEKLAKSMK